jgi:peptide/nickel transport system ATP-binding protein
MMPLLSVENLSVHYRSKGRTLRAVDQVSFQLEKGQSLGLVGESGSGKSTIGHAIMGLQPANAKIAQGRILFDGHDLVTASVPHLQALRWKKIAMIFQTAMNAFNPIMRVGDQIIETILTHEPDASRAKARYRVAELFDQVGLASRRMDDYPHQYSGGMRQRAIIAMALACWPAIIIADEPTTALDVIVQDQILKTIARLQRQADIGILFISHDISVVADVCHHIGVMYAGQLLEMGTCHEVFDAPAHPYTRALLGAHITLRRDRKPPQALTGQSPDLTEASAGCRFCERCSEALPNCARQSPKPVLLSPTHWVRCCHGGKARS